MTVLRSQGDRAVLSVVVSALKALITKVDDLAETVSGLAERFTTKELAFERGRGIDLTLSHQLCIEDDAGEPVCVTGSQLRSLLNGSVVGASSQEDEEAAGAPSVGNTEEAAGGSPASSAIDAGSSTPAAQADEDTATTITSAAADPGANNAPAANDNQPAPVDAVDDPTKDDTLLVEDPAAAEEEPPAEEPAPEPDQPASPAQ